MSTRVFQGSIYSAHKNCDCGGTYERHPHHQYTRDESGQHPILFPFCADCGEAAPRLMFRFKVNKTPHDIVYDRMGNVLTNIEACIQLSHKIQSEVQAEVFDYDNYKGKHRAGSPAETVDRFISRVILKQFPERDEHPDYRYYKEFMAGYFSDTGIFALSDIHLELYIRDMRIIKEPQRRYVRNLFQRLIEMRPDFSQKSA